MKAKERRTFKRLAQRFFPFSWERFFHIFASYDDVFRYIASEVEKRKNSSKLLIILDEYSYMTKETPELSSLLQRVIDQQWSKENIMLVLCGSSVSFMQEEVLGSKPPLYGRRTAQLANYSFEEKAIVYGITGGIPKYLSRFDSKKSLESNIVSEFFEPSGYFYEEPMNLLRQEFRSPSLYASLLGAIASGATRVTEIANKTGFDMAKVSQGLSELCKIRVIYKDVPLLNEKNKRLHQYRLGDGMFRFYFGFAVKGIGAIERGYGEEYYRAAVKPHLHDFTGEASEGIAQDYLFCTGLKGEYGFPILQIGKWRGMDPKKKEPADIDVVGIGGPGQKKAIIGECKFKNEPVGKKEYDTLQERAALIAPYEVQAYFFFSLSGFTEWVLKKAEGEENVHLISLEELYERK